MNITARIAAAFDGDLAALLYQPMVEAAKRGRAAARKEFEGMAEDARRAGDKASRGGPYRQNGGASSDPVVARARRVNREIETEQDRHNAEMAKKAKQAAREAEQAARRAERDDSRSRERISEGAVRNFGGVARRATGVAGDLARGAGVDFSIGAAAKSRFELEKRAVDLSNAAYMPGDNGPAGKRQDPRQLMATVQEAAAATALDTNKAMEGLQAFVGKTGDLSTGRVILKDMAVLSRATGGELQDIVSAAGDVSANLGDVGTVFKTAEDKGRAVASVMYAIAAQGKVGAVEMKDLATQMAKLAASAPQFAGSVDDSMASMGALAQAARAKGGAASATQAATSVQGFVATFGKKARRDAFKAAGVQIENEAGLLLDPEEIIVNSLKATKGDTAKMNKLFMDASAQRVTRGFKNIYAAAEQRQKGSGEAAVRAEFAKYKSATMKQDERSESFKASMQTSEAKATALKNQIERDLGDAVEKLAPELMKLTPKITETVGAFGKLVVWAAQNPFQAAMTGFGAAVMKSVAEEMMRASTARMFGLGGGGGGGPGGGGGGFMGGVGSALAIASMAVATFQVGKLLVDQMFDNSKKAQDKAAADEANALNAETGLAHARQAADADVRKFGFVTPETQAKLMDAEAEAEKQRAIAAKSLDAGEGIQKQGLVEGGLRVEKAALNSMLQALGVETRVGNGETMDQYKAAQLSAERLSSVEAQLISLNQIISGGIKITDMPALPQGAPALGGPTTGPGGG